jgi:ribonuclease J
MATCCIPGDWKLDPHPLIGPPTDEAAFARLGEEGVLAMVCDSTNAMVEAIPAARGGPAQPGALIKPMRGRVAVSCFATNLARVESIALAAKGAGRDVALFGRSLRNAVAAARECGYLSTVPDFLTEEEAGHIPDDNLCSSAPAARARSAARWPRSRPTPIPRSRSARATRSSSPRA